MRPKIEVEERVDLVAIEEVVADGDLVEQIRLPQRGLLPVSAQQVEQLRLQRRARAVCVEVGEKRIVLLFEDDRGIQALREVFGERRLADADRALDRDVTEGQGCAEYNSPSKRARTARRLEAACYHRAEQRRMPAAVSR